MWVHYTVAFTLLDDLSVSCPRLRPCLLSDAKFLSKNLICGNREITFSWEHIDKDKFYLI